MELGRLALSENLRGEIEKNPLLEIEAAADFDFDGKSNLISPFMLVEETAGRR
jgi:DNA-directed RNA polymerase specialized sigma54-like protein